MVGKWCRGKFVTGKLLETWHPKLVDCWVFDVISNKCQVSVYLPSNIYTVALKQLSKQVHLSFPLSLIPQSTLQMVCMTLSPRDISWNPPDLLRNSVSIAIPCQSSHASVQMILFPSRPQIKSSYHPQKVRRGFFQNFDENAHTSCTLIHFQELDLAKVWCCQQWETTKVTTQNKGWRLENCTYEADIHTRCQ